MGETSMKELERIFLRAKEIDMKYIAIIVEMPESPQPEIIINDIDNMESKLAYYKNTYDEELNHKFAKGIRILWFTFGNSFVEIEREYKAYCNKNE
jgi:hypothetical protein